MLKIKIAVALLTILGLAGGCREKPEYSAPVRIASYNIQYPRGGGEENPWEARNVLTEKILDDLEPEIFGVQEPYLSQIEDMMEYLGGTYAWAGTTDVKGGTGQYGVHHNPVFYRKDRFAIKGQGHFWLSETPDSVSKFDDSYSFRMCNWVRFEDLTQGVEFYHFNCHFDHKGVEARKRSGMLIREKVAEIAGGFPAFLTGDFNSDQDSEAYRNIVGTGVLADSYNIAESRENEEWYTYNGYRYSETPVRDHRRIDHLFVTPGDSKVLKWVLANHSYDGKYPSDHFPIVADLCILMTK